MIYINGRFLCQPLTGVNRYAYELCKSLLELGVKFKIIIPPLLIKADYNVDHFQIIRFGIGSSHFWEQICLPLFFVNKPKSILVSFTGLGPIFLRTKIITIHDLAYLENPHWYSRSYYWLYRILTPLAALTSLKILTVSKFSKEEIHRLLNINLNNIEVIYNAVDHFRGFGGGKREIIDQEYILSVASLDPRKNFRTLVKAFSLLKNTKIKLFIVGASNRIFADTEIDLDSEVNVCLLGRVSDFELKELYQNASLFVYPSFYEGFGLPPIEAMSLGCPSIVSDIPVFREVCGNASLYVNPYDESDIATKIDEVLSDSELRKRLMELGLKRANHYSWNKSVQSLVSVLNGITQVDYFD